MRRTLGATVIVGVLVLMILHPEKSTVLCQDIVLLLASADCVRLALSCLVSFSALRH